MDKTSLCCNELFMRSVYARTIKKQSGVMIAKALNPMYGKPESPVIDSTITNVWSKFGGKQAFLDEMRLRRREKKPLAEPQPEKKTGLESLLTEKELQKLAGLARHMCLTQAVIQLREYISGPPLTVGKVSTFLKKECGSITGLIEQYGAKKDS